MEAVRVRQSRMRAATPYPFEDYERAFEMAKQCFFTGKRTRAGKRISHAHNVTNRTFEPNLKRVRAMVDGAVKRIWVSTSAIKSGLVVKLPVRNWKPEQPEA